MRNSDVNKGFEKNESSADERTKSMTTPDILQSCTIQPQTRSLGDTNTFPEH